MLVLPLLNPKANLSSRMGRRRYIATDIALSVIHRAFDKADSGVGQRQESDEGARSLDVGIWRLRNIVHRAGVVVRERHTVLAQRRRASACVVYGRGGGKRTLRAVGQVETGKWIALGSGLAALTYLVHLHLSLIELVATAFSVQSAVSDPAAWRWRLLPRLLPCLGGRGPAWRPQAPWR
jgi:hypothetical protein